jgi:hypothetical protein
MLAGFSCITHNDRVCKKVHLLETPVVELVVVVELVETR